MKKRLFVLPLALAAVLAGGAARVVQDQCGPFVDVTPQFCPFVLELYYLGITAGTSATTYSPDNPLTRGQAAVFVAKGLDQALARSSRRAALGQWFTTQTAEALGLTTLLGGDPLIVASDGVDLWVSDSIYGLVSRVRASDGKLLETWTGADSASGVLTAMGRVVIAGRTDPGTLYIIDPALAAGTVTTVAGNLGANPFGIAFDGSRIWTANNFGSVSIVTPSSTVPWSVTTITTGFASPLGALYDGNNIWISDQSAGSLLKLSSNGDIAQSVPIGGLLGIPVFDGANIWVPVISSGSVAVVRASTGLLIDTLTGNGLAQPAVAASDGERVLVTNEGASRVSLWRAADLTPIGSFSTGTATIPFGACSDGLNFWIALNTGGQLARF